VGLSGHPSDSSVQLQAEVEIVTALAARWGIDLVRRPNKIPLSDGVAVKVDAASPDLRLVVEAYARQGRLKGAQPKKIAQDILKLALIKRVPGRETTRVVIAFASQEHRDSISGWLQHAADSFGVEPVVVEIAEQIREAIRRAQGPQVMANMDMVTDDLDVPAQEGP
jgi:hypothetical protein